MDISSRHGVRLDPNRIPQDGPAAIEAAGYGTLWVDDSPDGDLQLIEQ